MYSFQFISKNVIPLGVTFALTQYFTLNLIDCLKKHSVILNVHFSMNIFQSTYFKKKRILPYNDECNKQGLKLYIRTQVKVVSRSECFIFLGESQNP